MQCTPSACANQIIANGHALLDHCNQLTRVALLRLRQAASKAYTLC